MGEKIVNGSVGKTKWSSLPQNMSLKLFLNHSILKNRTHPLFSLSLSLFSLSLFSLSIFLLSLILISIPHSLHFSTVYLSVSHILISPFLCFFSRLFSFSWSLTHFFPLFCFTFHYLCRIFSVCFSFPFIFLSLFLFLISLPRLRSCVSIRCLYRLFSFSLSLSY